ncbi:hypothetical protein PPERSA_09375 [Pseudocohnilembus persalinus]|uniref:Transmembrane protein n=1 Tax=Pseudocohnilembus persalinus TaxID=266149 RepID=A0A0V0QL33_PSEPJ|nr:hypothetical protein PPERSA_09375 [Pseudocohnilembus persalinus]|eukprot:KRX02957.1 hypothetical protein PPERSA_09375 [Pseudocohnilembus persalinus]
MEDQQKNLYKTNNFNNEKEKSYELKYQKELLANENIGMNLLQKYQQEQLREKQKQQQKKYMTFLKYYILGFFVLYSINLLYRLYYLLEYDIYIYHPRVSEWHVYRFR